MDLFVFPFTYWLICFEIINMCMHFVSFYVLFILSFCLFFRAAPTAYGGSQARGPIRATAAGLHHSHSNVGSELSATYIIAHGNAGSLIPWARPGTKPETSWFLVGFVSAAPWQKLPIHVILVWNRIYTYLEQRTWEGSITPRTVCYVRGRIR